MMLLLCVLTVYTSHSQTVRPILLLPDSTEAYTVTRPWMEFALHSIELAPLQELTLDILRHELVMADDQLDARDMINDSLMNENERLISLFELTEDQLVISQKSVGVLAAARRRATFWGRVTSVTTIALAIVAILK